MRYFLIFFLVFAGAQAQRYNTATSYLQFVDKQHAAVVDQTWNYMYTYTQESDVSKRNGQRKKLENILNRSLRYIRKEKAFDPVFQKAAITYLEGNLAIVQGDYAQLLKYDIENVPVVNKNRLLKKIRDAMYRVRSDYDQSVTTYATTHDLKITKNDSALAQQMAHTIKVYQYYNDLSMLILQVKDVEANLWKDVTAITPDQFRTRLNDLQKVIDDNKFIASQLSMPSDNEQLKNSFLDFQEAFTSTFEQHTPSIIAILQAYSTNNRTNIVEKTAAFNKAKTWYNNNRIGAFTMWSKNTQEYLRAEVRPL